MNLRRGWAVQRDYLKRKGKNEKKEGRKGKKKLNKKSKMNKPTLRRRVEKQSLKKTNSLPVCGSLLKKKKIPFP